MQDATADAAIAHKVLAGKRGGHAELYDWYGMPLYAYCYGMLEDREQAAGAVGVTFMIAVGRLGLLRDLARLRPWLYALAHNECRYRMNPHAGSGQAGSGSAAAGNRRDIQQAEGAARSSEAPAPVESGYVGTIAATAIRSLSLDEREAIELCLRHHVLGPDLADVLGMPLRRAYATVTRARAKLRRALGTLLVADRGREDCPDLAGMLASWNGEPTALVSRRVHRHIACCDTCRDLERRELQSKALATVLTCPAPSAAPAELRDDVLQLLATVTVEMATEVDPIGELAARRVGSFGPSGFPVPRSRRGSWRTGRRPQFAGMAVIGVAAGTIAVLLGAMPRGMP